MGKQISFYMMRRDEEQFLEFLCSDRNVAIYAPRMSTKEPLVVDILPELSRNDLHIVWLRDLDHSQGPRVDRLPGGEYSIDGIGSEVIELQRSFLDRGRLVLGRIWVDLFRFVDSVDSVTPVKKSTDLEKWFSRLANWIRRRGVADRDRNYVLPGAREYEQSGSRLVRSPNVP